MFARRVFVQLKPNAVAELTRMLEEKIIPLLRKQNGFQDEITFTTRDGKGAFGISFWDRKESADAYVHGAYAEVVKMLETLVEGAARVGTYDVCNSTCHRVIATAVA